MNWFTRLFVRKSGLPPLKETIYMRGNRWFPHPQQKWFDDGYSRRQAQVIFLDAYDHCCRLNQSLSEPMPPTGIFPSAAGLEVEE